MNRDRWKKAAEVFERALELEPDARDAFVARICGGDASLVESVRAFLAAYETESLLGTRRGFVADRPLVGESNGVSDGPAGADVARVGPYRILGVLGRGSMGVVYRAQHMETGELAAVKTVRIASEALLDGFRREVRALARLRHPGIVRVLDDGVHEGLPWYAMELLDGVPLRSVDLTSAGPDGGCDLGAVLSVVRRLCAPLAFLHGEGIVHRDLKPDNIVVLASGRPVLVDFGVASSFAGPEGREALEALGVGGGTLAYMAPEQFRGEPVDARADLYALGCILYELLTGRPPFEGRSVGDYVDAHVRGVPAPPSTLATNVTMALDALVLKLLAKRPADRIGYADDIAAELGRLGGAVDPESSVPSSRAYLFRAAFGGREEVLAAFDEGITQLGAGRGGVVFVSGESGIGKTRLAVEVGSMAMRAGARVLAGECLPSQGREATGGPLYPLRPSLRRIADRCRERGEAETDRLLGPRGRLLARYEPGFSDLPGQAKYAEPADLPADAARLRLFEAVAGTLVALSAERPLVLIVDDVQWADELTLGVLGYATRTGRFADAPVLVIATYRAEEENESIRTVIAEARRVELGRLEADAVTAMVGGMLALDRPPRALGEFLARHSEGNPFFVSEYLRAAVDERVLWRDPDGVWRVGGEHGRTDESATIDYERLGLPDTIRALVARRLSNLDAEATRVLGAAAVLGRECGTRILGQLTSLERDAVAEAIEGLLRRQILEETTDLRLRFTHDKLREAAYEGLDAAARARLHEAAAVALEAAASGDREEQAAVLGEHWERAGVPERARPYYLAAARRARAQYAHGEAERLYRSYLELLDEPTVESVAARNELGWEVLRSEGRLDLMAREHERAAQEAERLEDRELLTDSLTKLGRAHFLLGRLEKARGYYERALDVSVNVPDANLRAMALNGLGSVTLDLGSSDEARGFFERALAEYRAAGNRAGESTTLGNIAIVSERAWAFEEASAVYTEALDIKREIGDQAGQLPILLNLGNLNYVRGERAASLAFLERTLALGREIGDRSLEGPALGLMANNHLLAGELDDARPLVDQALSVCRASGQIDYEGEILGALAGLHADEGRADDARATYDLALAIHRRLGLQRSEADAVLGRAILERRTANLDLGELLAGEAEAIFRDAGDPVRALLCACERGHSRLAHVGPACDVLDEVERAASHLGVRPASELGRALGRLRRAVEAFDAGVPLLNGELPDDVPAALRSGHAR